MRMERRTLLLAGSAALLGCGPQGKKAGAAADLILFNGQVLTVDPGFSVRSAVAVKDGKILAVGGPEILNSFQAAEMIDLAGRTLMPGFIDTHVHIYSLSPRAIEPDKVKSIAELQEAIRAKAQELGKGEWITGYGWDEAQLAEKRNPLKGDLDKAARSYPSRGALGRRQLSGAAAGQDHKGHQGSGKRRHRARCKRGSQRYHPRAFRPHHPSGAKRHVRNASSQLHPGAEESSAVRHHQLPFGQHGHRR
jgi:hypothetical protein